MTHYTFSPTPVKSWLYATDAERRPQLHLEQRWQPYAWPVCFGHRAVAEWADAMLMQQAGIIRRTVRGPLRVAGIDCGGAQP